MTETIATTTQAIIEQTQFGAVITSDMETTLLRDPQSIRYKEFQTVLLQEIVKEIEHEEIMHILQEQEHLTEMEEEQIEREAYYAKQARDYQRASDSDSAKTIHSIPAEHPVPELALNEQLAYFIQIARQLRNTNQDLLTVEDEKKQIAVQWQQQQYEEAVSFINRIDSTPLILPNGQSLDLKLTFDPNSPDAAALRDRLAATPLTAELINRATHTDMRTLYDKQVKLQLHKLQIQQPQLSEPEQELAARQQAIYDLNLDLRQLQNKFILSIPVIHQHMKNKWGDQGLNDLVNDYNKALGIDVEAQPHKKFGIYKILNLAITPLFTMQPRCNINNLDHDDLNVNYIKFGIANREKIQQLEQKRLAQKNTLRALAASLRHASVENANDDLNDVLGFLLPSIKTQQSHPRNNPFKTRLTRGSL